MTEALQRYNEETNKTITKADILEYLAFSTYMEGEVQTHTRMIFFCIYAIELLFFFLYVCT